MAKKTRVPSAGKAKKIKKFFIHSKTFVQKATKAIAFDEENFDSMFDEFNSQAEGGLLDYLGISNFKNSGMRITTNPGFQYSEVITVSAGGMRVK